ncbi:unnamed protein product [Anisakis simplex]|uniref:Uncharacterized protein n=1 Tax=Anisakis simplex TaxID=6269 RepID=A0A0M3KFB0_ANISI|nr:unnamed protein product [Anisakis simplex]
MAQTGTWCADGRDRTESMGINEITEAETLRSSEPKPVSLLFNRFMARPGEIPFCSARTTQTTMIAPGPKLA